MTHPGDTDRWVERLAPGAPDRGKAIEQLRDILVRGLTRTLTSHPGAGLQAEDVAQDALLKILDALDSFEGRSRFTTWAMTIATRVGISELRRKHYQDVSLDSLAPREEMAFDPSSTSAAPLADESERVRILATLQQLIESELTDKQRVATRALLEGIPVEQIADRTGSNRNAIYKLIHDARLRLRSGFERGGIRAADIGALVE